MCSPNTRCCSAFDKIKTVTSVGNGTLFINASFRKRAANLKTRGSFELWPLWFYSLHRKKGKQKRLDFVWNLKALHKSLWGICSWRNQRSRRLIERFYLSKPKGASLVNISNRFFIPSLAFDAFIWLDFARIGSICGIFDWKCTSLIHHRSLRVKVAEFSVMHIRGLWNHELKVSTFWGFGLFKIGFSCLIGDEVPFRIRLWSKFWFLFHANDSFVMTSLW